MADWLIALLLITNADSLRFDLDWAAFHHCADSSRVEFYYGVGYDQLNFQPQDNHLTAPFLVSFEMNGLDNQFRESGTIQKRARIRSFQEAAAAERRFVDQFSVITPAGRYQIKTTLSDSLHRGTIIDTITISNYGAGLTLSSVQLGAGVVTDSLTGGFAVIPNPGRRFIAAASRKIYAYVEAYGLKPDSLTYQVRYHLIGANRQDTLLSSTPIVCKKTGTRGAIGVELALDSLQPGRYTFVVQVVDPGAKISASAEKELVIG
ncbi:MAG: hypothetical protein ACUVUR_07810, partial [bacterium]